MSVTEGRGGLAVSSRVMSPQMLLAIIVVFFATIVILGAKSAFRSTATYPYIAADGLLTQGELAFQRVIATVAPKHACINSKVRLADIINVDAGLSKPRWSAAFAKIQSKHIDFVLCDRTSMKILCAIELHDKSHDSERRSQRDAFVRQAFAAAKVPYLEVKASRAYNQLPTVRRNQVTLILTRCSSRISPSISLAS